MNRMQWKWRKFISILLSVIFVYFLIRVRHYDHKMVVFLPEVHPNEPWEYVADFSNMKSLNPTLLDFIVTDESGNYDHWKYTVNYWEKLSHWPHLDNHGKAHFQVRAGPQKDVYYIHSNHITCLFMGLYCLETTSEFKFSKSKAKNGAICEETITYQCPAFLKIFCSREVLFQRQSISENLEKRFRKHIKM